MATEIRKIQRFSEALKKYSLQKLKKYRLFIR